jgi:type VI secretion system protein ImpH
LTSRLSVGTEPLLHYSGLFSSHPRSAERLRALVSDWLGREVAVMQFAGAWLPLAPEQRTCLAKGLAAGAWNRLSVDAAVGVRAWDPQARVVLRIGPLNHSAFTKLLPDRRGLQDLVSLVRAFLGFEIGFAVNPVLAGPEVPPLSLDNSTDPGPRLGWNTWIPAPGASPLGIRRRDAAEAVFEAEIVEAEEARRRGRARA